ncbi:MAG: type II secretion system protein GspG, partial [Candidatus Heimdallarchaeota archaeon]
YLERRQMLKERSERLIEELGVQDALSLRKIEREEVMKGVLRWLFGPAFDFVPPNFPEDLYGTNEAIINDIVWSRGLEFGEFIKFIHHAIEWENMLYFLYPYFWSHTNRWNIKKSLDHPDPLHKSFLKSGSARVVLTIRPGFEKDFLSIIETGTGGELPTTHPYFKISDEIKAFAETNYPGIPAANPETDVRPLIYPKQKKAWEEMKNIMVLLDLFNLDNGRYPKEAEGLAALTPYVTPEIPDVPIVDPWGKEYDYIFPGTYGDYDLVSYGADNAPGGEGENADITSWATASLIGSWYEYTPTGALDIVMDEKIPES